MSSTGHQSRALYVPEQLTYGGCGNKSHGVGWVGVPQTKNTLFQQTKKPRAPRFQC